MLSPPLRIAFVMKMYRGLPNDVEDMAVLWPRVGFATAEEAVAEYFAAYPHAPEDPHLDQLICEVARRVGDSEFVERHGVGPGGED